MELRNKTSQKSVLGLHMKMNFGYCVIMFSMIVSGSNAAKPCVTEFFKDSLECVCNSTYCDTIEQFEDVDIQSGSYVHYESSMKGKRLYFTKDKFSKRKEPVNIIARILSYWTVSSFTVDPSVKYQEILGFGGAVTDSVGFLFANLTRETQKQLLRQLFGNEGLSYTFVRIPMGATDFSSHKYSYDDNGIGFSLSNFNLTMEDYEYKIPLLKAAKSMSTVPIKIMAAPWTAPKRMLQPISPIQFIYPINKMKSSYYSTYAEYFIKFLDFYKKEGIQIWALSMQNEPIMGLFGTVFNVSIGWRPSEQVVFIDKYLGPLFDSAGYGNVKIIAVDDNWIFDYIWGSYVINRARKYISGVGIHSYFDSFRDSAATCRLHNAFPDLFLLYTETSIIKKAAKPQPSSRNRSWGNLETYVDTIFNALNNCVQGWIDWNIFLDKDGGPSFSNWPVDAPIKIKSTSEFFKQTMWYGIAHFSHFIPQRSKRIDITARNTNGITSISFWTPMNRVIIVLLNRKNYRRDVVINVSKEDQIRVTLSPRSLHTFVYKVPL